MSHKKYILAFFLVVAILSIGLLKNPEDIFARSKQDRQILSAMLFSPKENLSERYKIVKVKNKNDISIEIYHMEAAGNFTPVSQIDTHNKYDGFFILGGNATNLAAVDLPEESFQEILAPGFDQNLVAFLNVIRFDPTSKSFTLLTKTPHISD